MQGTNILYPHGKAVLSNLEREIFAHIAPLSYDMVELPEIVPPPYVAHLREDTLFKVENDLRQFYLAGSAEMQSSFLAKQLAQSYKDLPLRFVTRSKVRREGDTTALVFDIEYVNYEFNAFFNYLEDATVDWHKLQSHFADALTKFHIPFVSVSLEEPNKSPHVLYAYFPFAGTFGGVFWSNILSSRYVENVDFSIHAKDNTRKWPIHLNAGFTTRILGAYLANHEDDFGFILDPWITPHEILLPRNVADSPNKSYLTIVDNLDLNKKRAHVENHPALVAKLGATGIPVLLEPGRHELSITIRKDLQQQWIDPAESNGIIYNYLSSYSHIKPQSILFEILTPKDIEAGNFNDGIVYIAKKEEKKLLSRTSLKLLGYIPEGACFVTKLY